MATQYETVLGFEIHLELTTATKVFCACPTTFGSPVNTQCCPTCMGLPGALPVLNKRAVESTIKTALALNCEIPKLATFDRKNYYYPDLPKNYQISQNYSPLGIRGYVDVPVGNTIKRVRINNVHLEEDAGKLIHPEIPGADYSLVDLNRAGTALIEIVSEPDMRSAEDAAAYMATMKSLLEYLEVSDCNMHEGRLRFEVNISLRPVGSDKFGTKVEIKNLASMRTALAVIEHEQKRQAELYNNGGTVLPETRLWDEVNQVTRAMRNKEVANDYRYFPEPDLVPIEITTEWRNAVQAALPELADAKRKRFETELGLKEYDAKVLTASKPVADYFERAIAVHNNPKALANWMMTEVLRELKDPDASPADLKLTPAHLATIVRLVDENKITGKTAKELFARVLNSGEDPAAIVEREGLAQVSDAGEIEKLVDEVLAANPDIIAKVRNGNLGPMQALVGQVMKKSRGKANPALVQELVKTKLGI
jgi:aspartyl-tRNA(Asn)/glutamyl-tRNA(Gln) amidotransferase subunit B